MRKVWILNVETLFAYGDPPRARKQDVVRSVGRAGNKKFSIGVTKLGVLVAMAEFKPLDDVGLGISWRELKPGEELSTLMPVSAGYADKLMKA